jgi:hypothetical protein
VTRKEIEQGFIEAGWEVTGSSDRVLVGVSGGRSIRAPQQAWGTNDPAFEIRNVDSAFWVRTIPTPQRAAELLEEYGGPLEGKAE